jgi:hypothetical protein
VPDDAVVTAPAGPEGLDELVAQSSHKRVTKKRAAKSATRRRSKPVSRSASSTRVKIGVDQIVLPGSLAAHLTSKDVKKLKALFKRVRKRAKKRAAKRGTGKKQ